MRMKCAVILGALLCLYVAVTACAGEAALPEKIALYYFYDNLCASCDATEEFDKIAAEELSGVREQYPYDLYRINVYTSAGKERYRALCEEMGLDPEMITMPVLFAGGRVFQGDEAIGKNLREAFLVAGEDLFVNGKVYSPATKKTGAALFEDYAVNPDAATVVYFYRITCEECEQAAPVIDGLPDAVAADGQETPVDIIRINTRSGNNGDRIAAFFEQYNVPDEDRMVPIVFTAQRYLAGYEAIAAGLADALASDGTGFVFPAGE